MAATGPITASSPSTCRAEIQTIRAPEDLGTGLKIEVAGVQGRRAPQGCLSGVVHGRYGQRDQVTARGARRRRESASSSNVAVRLQSGHGCLSVLLSESSIMEAECVNSDLKQTQTG
ncbi:hypothetical protein PVAP13_6KG035300 [Panicum virgatum]|jgi:hypothetical protein|uniref:Uncharacterized protein n=1 Tax=Panicum virgatum TaxID=38727 RepID=A0A8T0R6V8_PANVG|nr:hypothetical protein PVAP13_6KG035300 [Panicum virgatum]